VCMCVTVCRVVRQCFIWCVYVCDCIQPSSGRGQSLSPQSTAHWKYYLGSDNW